MRAPHTYNKNTLSASFLLKYASRLALSLSAIYALILLLDHLDADSYSQVSCIELLGFFNNDPANARFSTFLPPTGRTALPEDLLWTGHQ